MPKRYEPTDMERIFGELDGESDRAAISVGSSLMEYALEEVIRLRLRKPKNGREENILFADNGIAGSFSEKIWLAYFLGVIGPETRRDIDLIRVVRNRVSHDMNPVSFGTPEIADRCRELGLAKMTIPGQTVPPDLRGMFLFTIRFLVGVLTLRANEHVFGVKGALEQLAEFIDR
jgi:hypothetical protein